ncbi:MAG: hypothetical protein Q9227_003480 [Pyrenula ochraceoflavens]
MSKYHQPLIPTLNAPKSTNVPWYDPDPGARLTPDILSFFKSYCNLSGDALTTHLQEITPSPPFPPIQRSKLWSLHPTPFTGQWAFLTPKLPRCPSYATILSRLKSGDALLDLGCCTGTDLRRLVADGAPSEKMWGADVEPRFWEVGWEMFRDRDRERGFKARFLEGDVLDESSELRRAARGELKGWFGVVYLGSVLHLWEWRRQVECLRVVAGMTKVGALVVGRQIGRKGGLEILRGVGKGEEEGERTGQYLHDEETMKRLWKEVGEKTGTKWKVKAEMVELDDILPEKRDRGGIGEEAMGMVFEAKRVK